MREPIDSKVFLGRLKDSNVTGIRAMTESEREDLSTALGTLRSFHRESQSYEHVRRDYGDFREYTAGVQRIIEQHGTSPDLALDVEVELNRRVMALLSSFRAFLDHTARALSRKFGEASSEMAAFRAACSAEFDQRFAYRFAYILRNYAQHYDLPIGQTRLRGCGQRRQHKIEVASLCVRDQLLASGFDWKKMTAELQQQPESWDIQSSIEALMPCIDRVRAVAIQPSLPSVLAAAKIVAAFAEQAGYPDAQPVVIHILEPVDGREHLRVTLSPQFHALEILRQYATHSSTA